MNDEKKAGDTRPYPLQRLYHTNQTYQKAHRGWSRAESLSYPSVLPICAPLLASSITPTQTTPYPQRGQHTTTKGTERESIDLFKDSEMNIDPNPTPNAAVRPLRGPDGFSTLQKVRRGAGAVDFELGGPEPRTGQPGDARMGPAPLPCEAFVRGCVVWMPRGLARASGLEFDRLRANPTGAGEAWIPFTARVPAAAAYLLDWRARQTTVLLCGMYEPVVLRHLFRPNAAGSLRSSEGPPGEADFCQDAAFAHLRGPQAALLPAAGPEGGGDVESGAALPPAPAQDFPEEGAGGPSRGCRGHPAVGHNGASAPAEWKAGHPPASNGSHGGEPQPSVRGGGLFISLPCLLQRQNGLSEAVQETLQAILCRHVDLALMRELGPGQQQQGGRQGHEFLKGREEDQERRGKSAFTGVRRRAWSGGAYTPPLDPDVPRTNSIDKPSPHHKTEASEPHPGLASHDAFSVPPPFWVAAFVHTTPIHGSVVRYGTRWIHKHRRLRHEAVSAGVGQGARSSFRAPGPFCHDIVRNPSGKDRHDNEVESEDLCIPWPAWVPPHSQSYQILAALSLAALVLVDDIAAALRAAEGLVEKALQARPFERLRLMMDCFLGFTEAVFGTAEQRKLHKRILDRLPFRLDDPAVLQRYTDVCASTSAFSAWRPLTREVLRACVYRVSRAGVQDGGASSEEDFEKDEGGRAEKYYGLEQDGLRARVGSPSDTAATTGLRSTVAGGERAKPGAPCGPFACAPSILDVVHYLALEYMTSPPPPPAMGSGEWVYAGLRAVGDALQRFLSEVDPSSVLDYLSTVEGAEVLLGGPREGSEGRGLVHHLESCVESYTRDFFPWRHWLARHHRRDGGGRSFPPSGEPPGGAKNGARRPTSTGDSPLPCEAAPPQLAVRAAYTYVKMLKWVIARSRGVDGGVLSSAPPPPPYHVPAPCHEANDLAFLLCVLPRLFTFHVLPQEVRCVLACALHDFSALACRREALAGPCAEASNEEGVDDVGEGPARGIRGAALRYFLGVVCYCAVRWRAAGGGRGELEKAIAEWLVPFFAAHWRAWWWAPRGQAAPSCAPGGDSLLEAAGASIADVAAFYARGTLRLLRRIRQEMRRRAIASAQRSSEDRKESVSSHGRERPGLHHRPQELDKRGRGSGRSAEQRRFAKVELESLPSRAYSTEPSQQCWGAKEAVSDLLSSETGFVDTTTASSSRFEKGRSADGNKAHDAAQQCGAKNLQIEKDLFWLKGTQPSFAFSPSKVRIHRAEVVAVREVIERILCYFSPTLPNTAEGHPTGHGGETAYCGETNNSTNNSNTLCNANAHEPLLSASLSCLYRALPWALEGYLHNVSSNDSDSTMESGKEVDSSFSLDTDASQSHPWPDTSAPRTLEESARIARKQSDEKDEGNTNTPDTATQWSSVSLSTTAEVESSA